jgi:hypothetical protein
MKVHNLLVTGSLTSGGENITEIAGTVTDLSSSLLTAMNDMSSSIKGMMATTGSNLFKGTQTLSGSIIPAVDNTYDLGSVTHQFRDLYLSSASLYIDGVKVLGSTAQELQITTDAGQSFKILEAGSDTITLQSNDGNITLATSGGGDVIMDPTNGIIALKGTTTVYAGNRILSSDGNNIHFGNGVIISGSLIATGTNLISGSSQILNGSGIISSSAQLPSGIVSSSAQVTGYGFSTTGSNAFIGTQTITGSLYISSDLVVQGSSSLQNITASVVNIGANIVNLNTANPAIRFAGLNIFDSGSIGGSGSFLYDAIQDEFIFIHRGDNANITSSVVLMGPQTYNNVGSETYPTNNRILKGTGNEHIGDSIISEINGDIGISGSLSITGSVLVGVDKGIIFDSSGASGNPEISIDSNVDLNFKNSAGLTNLKLKNNGDTIISGSLSLTGNITSTSTPLVSGSSQIDVMSTTNIARLATTGSNTFSGNILISKTSESTVQLNSTTATSYSAFFHSENGTAKAYWEYINSSFSDSSRRNYLEAYNAVGAFSVYTAGSKALDISTTGAATFSNNINVKGDINIGDYTTNTTLTFQSVSNGTSRINFYDANNTEGVYIRNIGTTYGGDLRFGARWDDDEDKVFFTLRQSSAGATFDARFGLNVDPTETFHVSSNGITASAPSKGWPVYDAELDTNARRFIFQTAGNGNVGTAGQGASAALILGQYFDSRVIITTPGAGSSSPSDQGTGRGRDMMIKAGAADNTVGYSGGRLYLNGGIGYGAGGFNANGGHIIMQGLTGSGNVGINDTNPQTKLSINGANYVEMATFACTTAASSTIVSDNAGYVQFSNGTARHLSNSSIFTSVTDGIRILKAGIVHVTVSQDIRTTGTSSYVLLYIQKNKSTVSENLISNTNGEWDGINGVATIAVAADDVINFYVSATDIVSFDSNTWSNYSFIWASR